MAPMTLSVNGSFGLCRMVLSGFQLLNYLADAFRKLLVGLVRFSLLIILFEDADVWIRQAGSPSRSSQTTCSSL